MVRIPVRPTLALLLLLTLSAPLAPAYGAGRNRSIVSGAGNATAGDTWSGAFVWQALAAALPPPLGRALSAWLESGCGIDPDGHLVCGAATSETERGCGADPNGQPLCGTKSELERGCGIDPDGRPLCGPGAANVDSGCGMDPDGNPLCLGH